MENTIIDIWHKLVKKIDAFNFALNKSKAVNVNSQILIDQGKEIVQVYFREVRPKLSEIKYDSNFINFLDKEFQKLLSLTNGRNLKTSYKKILSDIGKTKSDVETNLELAYSQNNNESNKYLLFSGVEKLIISTLAKLVPSAALSYEQAINDFSDDNRISFRGTGTELREAVREVLDCLAPDDVVVKSEGFKLEKDRSKPTMKQKAKFILKSRKISKTSLNAPQDTIEIIENNAASLARSVYERGSLSTHIATSKAEVLQLKLYVDSILAELLEIHKNKG